MKFNSFWLVLIGIYIGYGKHKQCNSLHANAPDFPIDVCISGYINGKFTSSTIVCDASTNNSSMRHLIYDDDGCQGNSISQPLQFYGNCQYNVTCSYSIIQTINECDNPTSDQFALTQIGVMTDTCTTYDMDMYTFCNDTGIFVTTFNSTDGSCDDNNSISTKPMYTNISCNGISGIEMNVICNPTPNTIPNIVDIITKKQHMVLDLSEKDGILISPKAVRLLIVCIIVNIMCCVVIFVTLKMINQNSFDNNNIDESVSDTSYDIDSKMFNIHHNSNIIYINQ